MPPIIFYSEQGRNPRIEYLLHVLQERLRPHSLNLVTDLGRLVNHEDPMIVYSVKQKGKGLWIPDSGALRQGTNEWVIPKVQTGEHGPILYPSAKKAGFPFDLPAAIFWMLARVEEYQDHTADEHGRFSGGQPLAAREDFLDTPVVDRWIQVLKKQLIATYSTLRFEPEKSRWQPTYDIDFAWRYRHRPLPWLLRTLARDLLKEGVTTFFRGVRQVFSSGPDPYDLYETWMAQQALLFFPVGRRTKYDRNYPPTNPAYRDLIRRWHDAGLAGIHPSYHTPESEKLLFREIETYRDITGELPTRSRQHYLRLRMPETFRSLEKVGIREDWSMGFADAPGFRAGTAYPFRWYDLEQERMSELTLAPTAVMDVTLWYYLRLSPEEATRVVRDLGEKVLETGGQLVTLGHNHSASGFDQDWRGWTEVLRLPMPKK